MWKATCEMYTIMSYKDQDQNKKPTCTSEKNINMGVL